MPNKALQETKDLYKQLTPENQKKAEKFVRFLLEEQLEEEEGDIKRIREVIEQEFTD